jgi:aspartyl aminopeptidase
MPNRGDSQPGDHLNRDANQGWAINAQKELPPILITGGRDAADFRALITDRLAQEHDPALMRCLIAS